MPRKRRIIMAVAGLASATFAIAASPGLAQAAVPASGNACTQDAEIIYSVNVTAGGVPSGKVLGNLQLKYSPSCRVTWARVASNYAPGNVYSYITSSAGFGSECPPNGIGGYMGCNTPMINDAGLTSYAYGQVWDGTLEGWAYTPSF